MRAGRRIARWLGALGLGAALVVPTPATAWDPSTTHLGMLERSVLDSAMHLRWMESSQLQRGLFSPLRVDPARLPEATRRLLTRALRRVHAASGAQAMGGPGACPGASAPEVTRAHCVEGDLWEMTALGWLELGVVVETVPAERLLHHFLDRQEPTAARWTDDDLPRAMLRAKHAKAGGTVASRATGGAFEGSGRSALAWLEDARDPWAPPALAEHLRRASLAADRDERDHHRALALLCMGALLHVIQDLSVPAHARGDISAMFLPLSEHARDRGLPLQELARDSYGRAGLPNPVALTPRAAPEVNRGIPRAPTLRAHVLGHGQWVGLWGEAGRRYFSESSLPAARALDDALSPEEAASRLLEGAVIDATEREGARLSAWPAERGYLLGGSGHALAAFRRDDQGQTRLWLDRHVYRTQMQQLIPLGVDVGRSVLDLVVATWPTMEVDAAARSITLTPGATWKDATLLVMVEDTRGTREAVAEAVMQGEGTHRVVEAWPATLAEDAQVVLVLRNPAGVMPAAVEQALELRTSSGKDAGSSAPRAPVPKVRTGVTRPVRGGKVPVRTKAPGEEGPGEEPGEEPSEEPESKTPDNDKTASGSSEPKTPPDDEQAASDSPEPETPDDAKAVGDSPESKTPSSTSQ
ncbi:MAG: hypothetical protein AAGF11_53110 [Myxococcota bacterium]